MEANAPFCGSAVAGSPLIVAYQGYFSEAYEAHKAALVALAEDLETALGTGRRLESC